MCVRIEAPAKVNLYLHITGYKDGFHELDSLVVFSEIHDVITCIPSKEMKLTITGPKAEEIIDLGKENIVFRAANLLAKHAERKHLDAVEVCLEKNLPVAAGLGGGSADAAATLKALCLFWGITIETKALHRMALSLGSDVPICLESQSAYFSGRGEIITPIYGLPKLSLLLINPGVSVSTYSIFKARTGDYSLPARIKNLPSDIIKMTYELSKRHNDLEAAAKSMVPQIGFVIDALEKEKACLLARMSGSGATCFGLFEGEEAAKRAALNIKSAHPGWWVVSGMSRI